MLTLAPVTTAKNVIYAMQSNILSKFNQRNDHVFLTRYNACLEEYTEVISSNTPQLAAGMDNYADNRF